MYVLFALSGIGCFRRFQRRVTNKEAKVSSAKGMDVSSRAIRALSLALLECWTPLVSTSKKDNERVRNASLKACADDAILGGISQAPRSAVIIVCASRYDAAY